MQCITLTLIAICCLSTGLTSAAAPTANTSGAPVNNFYLELKGILRTVPRKQIQHLVQAYLLNDAEFQAVIREINSMAAFRLRQQLLMQPELRQFVHWLAQQLILSGGSIKVFDELELEIKLFNKYPYWAQSVGGIAGFEDDFNYMYSAELLRNLLETSAQQNPIFDEFWRRVVALKPVYERFLATPQAKLFVGRLRGLNVNVDSWDSLVRYQLGWSNVTVPSYNYDYGTNIESAKVLY